MTEQRYVCIHGHFYQPPRENPWLEAIELQESAAPFHDWNARITAECYSPNSAARIQASDGHILGIVNNYARISFNFGPTLLSWMEHHSPLTYQAILDADRESIEKFGGHGSALAQVYNHMIMPLANQRDQESQILWGLRDFEYRFGRKPEGMWLAEAAVSIETLELLAENGIAFTILAPSQAAAVRPSSRKSPGTVIEASSNADTSNDSNWTDISGGRIDPARAYRCSLPSGKSISLFFYDGPISQAVAFEGILNSGEAFAARLLSGLSDDRHYPQLLHIATDGETYGHHHKFGDMALAYALHYIETNNLAQLTNYGQFLELHPPEWEVQIVNNSSWSCAHGISRWADDCGCSSGMHPGWSQQWRKPLRESLDWLRDSVNAAFQAEAPQHFDDLWGARNDYINVILDRTPESIDAFFAAHANKPLTPQVTTKILQLMELQRQMMLMYTSCGWFFDEVSGLETVQILQYASRAIQLAEVSLGLNLEDEFIERLRDAKSNIPANRDGATVYKKFVKPARVDLVRVGAHHAVMQLFKPEESHNHTYAFTIDQEDWQVLRGGQARMAIGRGRVTSDVTRDWEDITVCVLHLGDQNLTAGVRGSVSPAHYAEFLKKAEQAFQDADIPQVIRLLDQEFGGNTYSLASLFKDQRQVIIDEILRNNMEQAGGMLRVIFENNASMLRFLHNIGAPQPEILRAVGSYVVGGELKQLLDEDVSDPAKLLRVVDDAVAHNLNLDEKSILLSLNRAIENRVHHLTGTGDDLQAMNALIAMTKLADELPFQVNFWQAQNVIYQLCHSRYPDMQKKQATGDTYAKDWVKMFVELSSRLKVNTNAL
jgi:alpha-amylase/alpha-mannosidase (GH57 family)